MNRCRKCPPDCIFSMQDCRSFINPSTKWPTFWWFQALPPNPRCRTFSLPLLIWVAGGGATRSNHCHHISGSIIMDVGLLSQIRIRCSISKWQCSPHWDSSCHTGWFVHKCCAHRLKPPMNWKMNCEGILRLPICKFLFIYLIVSRMHWYWWF